VKRILRSVLRALARRLQVHLSAAEADQFIANLKRCGIGVSIRMPCVIESPEMVEIGDHVSIASFVHVWGNFGVRIGDRTMIGSHVAITSATHDPDHCEMHLTLSGAPVEIGNDVWIGAHSVIFPGVRIGSHAVVAAGSVVRESVPDLGVVAGVPARLVRMKVLVGPPKPVVDPE
jgi:maltose O-acetyltransferase